MPSQEQNTFVFIGEDQRHKYSKSTLSAINAQVAKHAHAQRRSNAKPKSKSVPSSAASSPPGPVVAETAKTSEFLGTQDDQINKTVRRTSAPALTSTRWSLSDPQTSLVRQVGSLPRERSRSLPQTKLAKEAQRLGEKSKQTNEEDETPPEELADLFQNLCRITKYPAYQAFPFFLDLEERRLAHYWFTEVLRDEFGMSLRLEETFQGELTRYPLAFVVPLRWIIAKAADRLHAKTGALSLTTVYRSRETALNTLQDIVKDSNTPTDEAVGSILQSIVNNPEFRKVHLRGLDAMIEARGGLESVARDSHITTSDHIFNQYTFAEYDITQLDELESLKSRFFSSLLSMQQHAHEYTAMVAQMDVWASSVDLLDCTGTGGSLQKWSYTEQRQRVFSEKTATGQLIRQKYNLSDELMRKSRLFAAIFQINAMLIEYDTIAEKSLFLRRLEQAAKVTASVDPLTGRLQIMAGAHIHMTGYVSRQVQVELGLGEYDKKGIPVAVNGIAAIKIFGLLLDSMRVRLLTYLQGWLLGTEDRYLTPGDINAMSATITQLWLQKMGSHCQAGATEASDYPYFQSEAA